MKQKQGHAKATRDAAEALVLTIESDGLLGVGECVPRSYVTGETNESVWDAIQRLDPEKLFSQLNFDSVSSVVQSIERAELAEKLKSNVSGLAASCLLELALLDWAGKKLKVPARDFAFALGLSEEMLSPEPILKHHNTVTLNFFREPESLEKIPKSQLHLKVKVGEDRKLEINRLQRCRELFGYEVPISVDANMAWNLEEALEAAQAFSPFRIAWYEEPLKEECRANYRDLREKSGEKVMLDEAACGIGQIHSAIKLGYCDLINIRISKCGGFLSSLRIADLCHKSGVGFQLGVQVGQIGILNAAGLQFSSAVKGILTVEGGYSLGNLVDQVIQEELRLDWDAGQTLGLSEFGLGVTLDIEKLKKYTVKKASWSKTGWSTV